MQLRAKGFWKVNKDSIRIVTDIDFCKYYYWLFMRGTWSLHKMQLPKHGSHVGIVNEKIHRVDCSRFLYLNNQEVYFNYNVTGNFGGFKKGFKNFWLDVYLEQGEDIQRELGIYKKTDGFEIFHLTICNSKNL